MAQIREDRHILAAILCGSLSHDEVWDKSDIDLVLVCADDKKTGRHGVALLQDDVNIHTTVQPRADFRRRIETAVRNTFEHSLFAKGRLLFSRDSSIDALLAELKEIGARDSRLQAMRSAQLAILTLYKARKWHATKMIRRIRRCGFSTPPGRSPKWKWDWPENSWAAKPSRTPCV